MSGPATDALPVDVHRGRRGRVAVARLVGASEAERHAVAATEISLRLGARWLVLDLSEVWASCDVGRILTPLRPRAALGGVSLALAGADVRTSTVGGPAPPCLVFPTVPIALGTLGAL